MITPLSVRPGPAAEMIGVSRRVIYQLMNAGELQSFRIGGARLIPVAELEEFIARRVADEQQSPGSCPGYRPQDVEQVA